MGMNGLLSGLGQGLELMYKSAIAESIVNKRNNIDRLKLKYQEGWKQKEFDQKNTLAAQKHDDALAANAFDVEQNQLDRDSREKIAGMRGGGGTGQTGDKLSQIDDRITKQYFQLFGDVNGIKKGAPPFGQFRHDRLVEYGVIDPTAEGGGYSSGDDTFSRLIAQSKEPGMIGKALEFGGKSISQGPPREKIKSVEYKGGLLPASETSVQPIPRNIRGNALR